MFRDHQLEREQLEQTKQSLSSEIQHLISHHKSTREQVEAQIWDSIDQLKDQQKQILTHQIDTGMRQKAELTKQNAKHLQGKQQKQKELNEIDECNQLLNSLLKQAEAHRQTLVSQKATLRERDQTLLSKSKRIEKLLVKTQELEKFKFVLDYKIKELKKDVKPNNEVSAQLKEQTTKME